MIDDSRVYSTPVAIKESSWTESAVMDDLRVQSTPVSTKNSSESDNDMMRYLCSMVCSMREESKNKIQCCVLNSMNRM